MPKVRNIGEYMQRGDDNNFYIRCEDDLDDQDTDTYRGEDEYPHIHVRTNGPSRHNDILYIGLTFGRYGIEENKDIFVNGAYKVDVRETQRLILVYLPRISVPRVGPLSHYLHNMHFHIPHQ